MFDQRVISPSASLIHDDALGPCLRVNIYSNWYRSLPLSAIEGLRVHLDGTFVPEDRIWAQVGRRTLPISALEKLVATYWFVRDPLPLLIRRVDPIAPGRRRVRITYRMRITDLVFDGRAVSEPADCDAEVLLR